MNHIWRMFEKNLCLIVKEGSIYSLVDKENGREGSAWELYNVLTHPVYFFPPKMGPHAWSLKLNPSFDLLQTLHFCLDLEPSLGILWRWRKHVCTYWVTDMHISRKVIFAPKLRTSALLILCYRINICWGKIFIIYIHEIKCAKMAKILFICICIDTIISFKYRRGHIEVHIGKQLYMT